MSLSDLLEITPTLITAFAAMVGARIAWLGLSTWKDQNRWSADSELAKRVVEALYRHSTALKRVRFPAIFPHEKEEAISGKAGPKNGPERMYFELASVYEARWNKVVEARVALQPLIFEAQVIWENDFQKVFDPLWKLEDELFRVVRLHLESMNPDYSTETTAEFKKMRTKERDILYFTDEASDVFNADYEMAMNHLMSILGKKLGRR